MPLHFEFENVLSHFVVTPFCCYRTPLLKCFFFLDMYFVFESDCLSANPLDVGCLSGCSPSPLFYTVVLHEYRIDRR
jgi:hypothetical protein